MHSWFSSYLYSRPQFFDESARAQDIDFENNHWRNEHWRAARIFSKNVLTRVKICRCTTGTSKRPGGRTRSCFVHLGGRAEIHCPHLNPLLSVFFFFSRAVYSVALLPGRFLTRCRCCAHETKTLLLPCFLMSRPASRHQRKVKADSGSFYIRQASLCRHSVGTLAFLDWL